VLNIKKEGEMRGYGEKRGRGVSESYSWTLTSSAISVIDYYLTLLHINSTAFCYFCTFTLTCMRVHFQPLS